MDRETLLALDKPALVEVVLELQRANATITCRPTSCGGCGLLLPPEGQRLSGRRQIQELPVVRPVVLQVLRYQAACANCGTRTTAEPPAWFAPHATFGPRVEALLAYLHETHHVSYQRLVELCRDVLGLRLGEGAIANALGRVATRAEPVVQRIREQVRASPVINSDETGARVDGGNRCHWVFQTPTASYHLIAATKGAAVIAEFLGDQRPVVWGSDAAPAQLGAASDQHQLCLAHQLRDLTYAIEAADPAGSAWARQLRHVFGRALRLHRERTGLSAASFAHRRIRVVRAAERLIFGPPLDRSAAGQLQKRYRQHWATLFVFLEREDVEPTNNGSERDLRPAVMHRKMTGGNRSEAGAAWGGILTTILTTAWKNGHNRFETLCHITGPSPLIAAHQGM